MNIVAWPWQLDPHSRHIQHGSTGCSSWAARYSSCPISLSLCIYIHIENIIMQDPDYRLIMRLLFAGAPFRLCRIIVCLN